MTAIVTSIVWLTGSAFALLAAIGVLRMPDVFTRMQASTKASNPWLGLLAGRRGSPIGRLWLLYSRREYWSVRVVDDTGGRPRHCQSLVLRGRPPVEGHRA